MNNAIIDQFHHQWRMLASTIKEFDTDSWNKSGHGLTTPPLTSFHILTSVRYYAESGTVFRRADGSILEGGRGDLDKSDILEKDEILANIPAFEEAVDSWLKNLELDESNTKHVYAGPSLGALALFVLRHSEYHLGEIGGVLNEYMKGTASDHFSGTLE